MYVGESRSVQEPTVSQVSGRQPFKGAGELAHVVLGGGKTGFRSGRERLAQEKVIVVSSQELWETIGSSGGLNFHLWVEETQGGILAVGR